MKVSTHPPANMLGLVDDVSVEDLDRMISINFRGVFLAIQSAVPYLRDGGRVITIGSNTAIRTGHAGSSIYQATKAAVAGLVKGLALDLAPRHITVNNVQPRPTATEIHESLSADCEQARHLTPDRLPRLTPPLPLDVPDTAKEISGGVGSRLGADRDQSSEPMHSADRTAVKRLA